MTEERTPTVAERLAKARGDEVRRAREALGWSQSDLAQRAGTSQQTVDRIERGVTENSRAYPLVREAVGLTVHGNEGFNPERFAETVKKMKEESQESYKQFMAEGRAISKLDGDHIPVLASGKTRVRMVDAIPRGYPVTFVEGAYAVIAFGVEMLPVFHPGDIAIVNPNIPPHPGNEIAVAVGGDIKIRTFEGETESHWLVKTWNPEAIEQISKSELENLEVVVARISRNS